MESNPVAPHLNPPAEAGSPGAPLLVWLVVQLLALGLSAARVRLWARFGAAGETYSLQVLVVAQYLVSSLLFPFLCRDRVTTTCVIVSSLPMIALAGYLSWAPAGRCGAVALNVAIWIAALGLWGKVANRWRLELPFVALVSGWNIIGAVLVYFIAEANSHWPWFSAVIPLFSAIEVTNHVSSQAFLPACGMLLLGVTCVAMGRVRLSTD